MTAKNRCRHSGTRPCEGGAQIGLMGRLQARERRGARQGAEAGSELGADSTPGPAGALRRTQSCPHLEFGLLASSPKGPQIGKGFLWFNPPSLCQCVPAAWGNRACLQVARAGGVRGRPPGTGPTGLRSRKGPAHGPNHSQNSNPAWKVSNMEGGLPSNRQPWTPPSILTDCSLWPVGTGQETLDPHVSLCGGAPGSTDDGAPRSNVPFRCGGPQSASLQGLDSRLARMGPPRPLQLDSRIFRGEETVDQLSL